jgi:hypothetical protein
MLGVVLAGCSVQRVPLQGPERTRPATPYDFEAEKPAPPPPAVQRAPAGGRSDEPSLETPAPVDLDAPTLQVEDLPAAAPASPPARLADQPAVAPATGSPASSAAGSAPVAGFRVQVFASPDREAAQRQRSDLEARLGEKVYVDYQPPYYKVRVGNCRSSEACAALQARLRQAGFTSVWTVAAEIEP